MPVPQTPLPDIRTGINRSQPSNNKIREGDRLSRRPNAPPRGRYPRPPQQANVPEQLAQGHPEHFRLPEDLHVRWRQSASPVARNRPDRLNVEEGKDRQAATLEHIEYGRARYKLRQPLAGEFQACGSTMAFRVDSLLPIVGEGEDRRDWAVLESHLDLRSYTRDRLITTYQRGEVMEADGDIWTVHWFDGRVEQIDLQEAPDDFAAFEQGDHFEAFVSLDPATSRLAHMYTAHPVEPPVDSDLEAWHRAVNSAVPARLPESTIDWTS